MKSAIEEPMKIREKDTNEVRLALLEQSIYNINETLIRFEKRFDRIDAEIKEFRKDFNLLDKKLDAKLDNFNARLWSNFYWILGTMFTLSCAGAGILAKGFGWLD